MTIVLRLLLASCAWSVLGYCCWTIFARGREIWQTTARLHRIPCSDCRYFTGDYRLKCPVRPCQACSEAAIDCPDFEMANS